MRRAEHKCTQRRTQIKISRKDANVIVTKSEKQGALSKRKMFKNNGQRSDNEKLTITTKSDNYDESSKYEVHQDQNRNKASS